MYVQVPATNWNTLIILMVDTACAGTVAVVKAKLVTADADPPTKSVKNVL